MEYIKVYPSSVPHITLVEDSIRVSRLFSLTSMIVEILFGLVCLGLFVFSCLLSFSKKNLIEESNRFPQNDSQKTHNNLIIKKQSQENIHSFTQPTAFQFQQSKYLVNPNHKLYERKFTYLLSYMIISIVCVNSFDCGILTLLSIGSQTILFIIFNIWRVSSTWKITLFFYIIPLLIGFYQFLSGNHMLYEWNQVK